MQSFSSLANRSSNSFVSASSALVEPVLQPGGGPLHGRPPRAAALVPQIEPAARVGKVDAEHLVALAEHREQPLDRGRVRKLRVPATAATAQT